MKTYRFAALLEPGDEHEITVSFPDLPEAISQGHDRADALSQAEEVLGLTLLAYLEDGRSIPMPVTAGPEFVMVTPEPEVAAKIAVIETFRASGLTQAQLATSIGRDGREVRRIISPDHQSKLPVIALALRAMGKRLVMSVDDAA